MVLYQIRRDSVHRVVRSNTFSLRQRGTFLFLCFACVALGATTRNICRARFRSVEGPTCVSYLAVFRNYLPEFGMPSSPNSTGTDCASVRRSLASDLPYLAGRAKADSQALNT